MRKGPQVSPAVVGIVIVVVILIVGVWIWKGTGTSTGVSGVGATSAALPQGGKPPTVSMPANPGGASSSNIPMPGNTTTMPGAPGR